MNTRLTAEGSGFYHLSGSGARSPGDDLLIGERSSRRALEGPDQAPIDDVSIRIVLDDDGPVGGG